MNQPEFTAHVESNGDFVLTLWTTNPNAHFGQKIARAINITEHIRFIVRDEIERAEKRKAGNLHGFGDW